MNRLRLRRTNEALGWDLPWHLDRVSHRVSPRGDRIHRRRGEGGGRKAREKHGAVHAEEVGRPPRAEGGESVRGQAGRAEGWARALQRELCHLPRGTGGRGIRAGDGAEPSRARLDVAGHSKYVRRGALLGRRERNQNDGNARLLADPQEGRDLAHRRLPPPSSGGHGGRAEGLEGRFRRRGTPPRRGDGRGELTRKAKAGAGGRPDTSFSSPGNEASQGLTKRGVGPRRRRRGARLLSRRRIDVYLRQSGCPQGQFA